MEEDLENYKKKGLFLVFMVDVKKLVKEGWLNCRVVIEVVGKPKEHVEKAMKGYIEKIEKEEDVKVVDKKLAELKKKETGSKEEGTIKDLWATFAELELLFKDVENLVSFGFAYMPSSIELIDPEKIFFSAQEFSSFMNDWQARLHEVDFVAKQFRSENVFLKKNLNGLLKNFLNVLLKSKERSGEEISKMTGVGQDRIEDFLDHLMDEGKVEEKKGKYKWK